MPGSRFALKLVAHGGSVGVREELIGDLLEEIGRGRSHLWVCQQVIGLYGFALMLQVRRRVRLSPPLIAIALGLALLAAGTIASAKTVLAMWLAIYYVSGTLSLFAHMASHTVGLRDDRSQG